MTNNYLSYHRLMEDRRSNLAKEKLQSEANSIAAKEADTHYLQYQENQRSNMAKEEISHYANVINSAQLSENIRHNQAVEAETNRSHLVEEAIKQSTLDETIRSNQAREKINFLTLQETIRANTDKISLGYDQLQETKRSNKANEDINLSRLYEQIRSNKENESIAWANVSNLAQANANNYQLGIIANQIKAQQLEETIRSNQEREDISRAQNAIAQTNANTQATLAKIKGQEAKAEIAVDQAKVKQINADVVYKITNSANNVVNSIASILGPIALLK